MTYDEVISFRDNEKTGIAKGYSLEYLRDFCSKEKLEKVIANDLAMFEKIEKSLIEINEPKEGDFVKFDGNISRLSRIHEDGKFQLSESIGVFVSEFSSQASGCVWDSTITIERDRLTLENLEPISMFKKGRCWTFSGNEAGGGRGVWFEINFKVWNLCQVGAK
ncbi:MAG: hypothetical protein PHE16_02970 [Aliarcobacter sp.]|nr:hypothetical protein [Aliarcobacter sp.]